MCLVVGLLAALLVGGCGDRDRPDSAPRATSPATPPRAGVERIDVGRGRTGAVVLPPRGVPGPLPGVLFLHGWGAKEPRFYAPWLRHLAQRGNAVIYPRYQETPFDLPALVLPNALTGLRDALRRVPIRPDSLVVAGHSAGGALAADYAAIAGGPDRPRPLAVFSAYPGRRYEGVPAQIPPLDLSRVPASTRIEVLVGTRDRVVGERAGRAIVADAVRVPRAQRQFVRVSDRRVSDHLGPQRSGPVTRRVFWARLDRLIAAARKR